MGILFQIIALVQCVVASSAFQLNVPGASNKVHFLPTTNSTSEECRNHTIYYLQELNKLTLWAAEMFDSSSKVPNGILFGSTYDLGNYDECVNIRVPFNDKEFTGKHCLAHLKILPPKSLTERYGQRDFSNEDYKSYFNISIWEKIASYVDKRSRSSRNDLYLSYCIPSSCSNKDLEDTLRSFTEKYASSANFQLEIEVESCSVHTGLQFNHGDILFISLCVLIIALSLSASLYDLLAHLEPNKSNNLFANLAICFSIPKNIKKLASDSDSEQNIAFASGMKVITMFLVILGHRSMFLVGSPITNPQFVEQMYMTIANQVLLNGPIIVNSFFVLSGFLMSYLILFRCHKMGARGFNLIDLMVHKLLRIVPAYVLVLGFYCTIFVKLGSGPLWDQQVGLIHDRCVTSWWANILFINNYVSTENICMFQSWYLSCDMHFFIVSLGLVYLLWKKPSWGTLITFGLIVLCFLTVFLTVYLKNEDPILLLYMQFLKDPLVTNSFRNVYMPSHMRGSAYFIGILIGHSLFKIKNEKIMLSKLQVAIGWIMCVLVMETTVYMGFIFYANDNVESLFSAFYSGIHHIVWSIAIGWMIIAVGTSNGSWIEPVLSWKPLTLLSRISYPAFLIHGAVQIYSVASIRHSLDMSYFNLVYSSLGDITTAYILGFWISMFIEAPVIGLEKLILGNKKRSQNHGSQLKNNLNVEPIKITSICVENTKI